MMIVRKSFTILLLLLLAGCSSAQQVSENKSGEKKEGNEDMPSGQIEITIDTQQKENTMYFQFHIENDTENDQTFHFNNGQRFDFVIKNEDGEAVKRFSKGMMFTQALGEETIKKGDTKTYTAKVRDLSPGEYSIDFWLTAKEKQHEGHATFTVDKE